MKKLFVLILYIMIYSEADLAQNSRDSFTFTFPVVKNLLHSSFNKLLNTSYYNGKLDYAYNSSNFKITLSENFKSTVIKSISNNIKDEQFVFLSGTYKFAQKMKFGTILTSSLYSGDKRLAINKAAYLNSLIFIKFLPIQNIELSPFAGATSNEQAGNKDEGFIYGFRGDVRDFRLSDFEINSSAKFQNEDISPRKNMVRFFDVKINSKLPNKYINTLKFQFSQLKKDFYLEADSLIANEFNVDKNIQSRNESKYEFNDELILPRTNTPFSFKFRGTVSRRNIDRYIRYKSFANISTSSFDTRIEENRLKLQSLTNFYFNSFSGNIIVGFSQREENHIAKPMEGVSQIIFDKKEELEEQKSNRSQVVSLSASGTIKISHNNLLLLSVFHRKFIYDTPSMDNYDDRDELLSIARIQFQHRFNTFFNIFINLDGTTNHIVYLFAQRSANNNKNRSIKLSSGSTYRGENITSTNIAEVSANYTTYDFENVIATPRSFAFRQIAFKDSSSIRIKNNLFFNSYGYVKLSEQGDFNPGNFSGKPARFLKEIYLEPKLSIPLKGINFGVGLRYYSLSTYGYNNEDERFLQSNFTSLGPLTEINYIIVEKIALNIYGYYEFISPENSISVQRANLNIKVNWVF